MPRVELGQALRTRDGFRFHEEGDVDEANMARGKSSMNCTARVHDGRVEIWAPTQVPRLCKRMAGWVALLAELVASPAGMVRDKVAVHVTFLGGGFGRDWKWITRVCRCAWPWTAAAHGANAPGVPVRFWRSVGHSHKAFFPECFVERSLPSLVLIQWRCAVSCWAERVIWLFSTSLRRRPDGAAARRPAGRGVALHESLDSIAVQVAEVSVESGQPRVHRVVCTIDCGTVLNPATVA